MRNEKGSVLSVAIIVVMLLSFSITTITAYTQNVATRTNTTISVRDDELIADTYLKQAMRDFRDTIQNSEYSTFQELDDFNVILPLIDRILDDYGVVVTETTGGDYAREYRFSYYIESLDQTLHKDLVISVELANVEGKDYRTIFDEEEGIINKFLASFDVEGDDNIYCHPDYDGETDLDKCQKDLMDEVGTTGRSGRGQLLNGDFYIGTDLDGGTAQGSSLTLNNNILIIDGNFDFEGLELIEGADEFGEGAGGIVIITGNLTSSKGHGITINNTLFLIQGNININFEHHDKGTFNGDNFVMFGYSESSVFAAASEEGLDYYTKTLTNLPGQNIEFVGGQPYTDIDLILDHFLAGLEEDAAYIYEFFY